MSNLYSKEVTEAIYKEQKVVDFQGNPLIEALPDILSPEEAYEALSYFPPFDTDESNLPTHIRYHSIPRISRFFQPVMQHLDLEQRFSRLLRTGYVSRNPLTSEYNKSLYGVADIRSTASSMTLMGFSGMGKTTGIERILSLYPQVILHKYPLNLLQVVWIKLNCPHDGSLKSLCMDFFIKIDSLLSTNYYNKFAGSRNSISSMVTQMGQIAKLHCVGAIIIDEIQHLLATKDNNSEKMMNYFVTLINEVGVPIMMIGTMRAKAILQQDFRQARRGSGQGDMVWQQMEKDDDWNLLIESLWEYQWLKNKVELTDELNDTLYNESQGIVDIAVKLFALAQGRAIETGIEAITPNIIKHVAKEDLKLVQPMLDALREGHIDKIEKYGDITPMDIADYLVKHESNIDLRATIQKQKDIISQKRKIQVSNNTEKIILSLITLGIEPDKAEKLAVKVIKNSKSESLTELMALAINEANTSHNKIIKEQKQGQSDFILIKLHEKAKTKKISCYELLKNEGYIKQPSLEFVI